MRTEERDCQSRGPKIFIRCVGELKFGLEDRLHIVIVANNALLTSWRAKPGMLIWKIRVDNYHKISTISLKLLWFVLNKLKNTYCGFKVKSLQMTFKPTPYKPGLQDWGRTMRWFADTCTPKLWLYLFNKVASVLEESAPTPINATLAKK